jgi:hypothetical protein
MASTKQAVIKALVNANLLSTFDRDAVNSFVAFVDENGGSPDAIASVIQAVRAGAARWRQTCRWAPAAAAGSRACAIAPMHAGLRRPRARRARHAPAPPRRPLPNPALRAAELIDDKRVTRQLLEKHLVALQGETEEEHPVTVVSAFDVPKISYDPIHKKFFDEGRPNSLLGSAQVRGAAPAAALLRAPGGRSGAGCCWAARQACTGRRGALAAPAAPRGL